MLLERFSLRGKEAKFHFARGGLPTMSNVAMNPGVLHKERLSRFDGSGYGCETKAVNRADNRTEDGLRSPRPRVPSPLFGPGRFPFLLKGQKVWLLSSSPSLTAFPVQKILSLIP
jgi:hypothetical protein